jgi:TP901 family phage tail tape measure protein
MARDPKAEVEISAQSRNLGARLREARAKFAVFGGDLKKNIFGKDLVEKGFWSKGGAQLVGNLGSTAATGAAGFLYDQAKGALEYRDALKRLQIAGGASSEQIGAMDAAMRRASDETGISKRETLAAARQYVALTGDLAGASTAIGTWARVAQASDSNIGDVASTAQALRDNLKIDPSQMERAFDILSGQGKQGAVEMSELRNQLATVTPLMAQFGGGASIQGLADLGATLQVVRKGFGSTEETVTGVQSLMTAMIKNADRLHRAGVDVYDKDPKTGVKHLKSFRAEFDAISNSKLMKDPTKLEKAFGRVEAYRAFLQLKDNRGEFEKLANASQYAGQTQKDLAAYMQSPMGRIKQAWTQAKNEITDALTPERAQAFATVLVGAAKALGFVLGKMGDLLGKAEDIADRAGKGWAKLLGGESEEDRISHLQAQRIDERRAKLGFDYMRQHPMASADERRKAVAHDLAAENTLNDQLEAQVAGQGITRQIYMGEQEGPLRPGEVRRVGYRQAGDYSLQELVALKRNVHGTSDEARTQQLIDQAISKKLDAQLAELRRMTELLSKGTQVKVDGKNIVDAHKNARVHSSRP